MNLSKWTTMSADTQDAMIAKIIREAKSGDMAPLQYRALHWEAKLTSGDIAALQILDKTGKSKASLSGPGDATHGKLVFQKRCMDCHALEGDREGPRLASVFGRKAGSVVGFDYSGGLKNSGMTWN